MSDDTTPTALEHGLISPREERDSRDGHQSTGCTPGQLRAALKAAGCSADAVRQHRARP
jgi:hypothetical protein